MVSLGQVEITNPTHNSTLMECLHSFTSSGEFTDICFVCSDKQKVYAHKLLLCTVSSELKTIIMELPEGLDLVTIHLPDVDSLTLKLVIDFVYEGYMRLTKREFDKFQAVMKLLGIVLATNMNSGEALKQQQTKQLPPPQPQPQPQPPPPPPLPPPPPASSAPSVQHHTVDSQLMNPQQQVVYVAPGSNQGIQYVVAANPAATNHMPANIQSANQLSNIPTSNGQILTVAPNQVVGIVQNQTQLGRAIGQRNQVVAVPQGSKIVSQGSQVVQQGRHIIRLFHAGDQLSQPQNQMNNMTQMNNIVQPANMQNMVRVTQNTNDLTNVAQNSRMLSPMAKVQNAAYVNSNTQQVRSAVNQNVTQNVITSNHYQVVSNNAVTRNNQTMVNGTVPAHTVTTMSNYGTKPTGLQLPSTSGSSNQNLRHHVNRNVNNSIQQPVTTQRRRKSSVINSDDVIMIDDRPDENKMPRINR